MGRITETVKTLIIANIIFFVGCLIVGNNAFDLLAVWYPENDNFYIWQIFTHMFMHSPSFFLHILFNMLALWMFGSPLEQIWGRNKFLFFYFSAGLGSLLFSISIDYFSFQSILNELVINGFEKDNIISILNKDQYNTQWLDIIGEQKFERMSEIFRTRSLGASGAVMGLLVAFGLNFPNAELMLIFLPIPIKAKYFIPLLMSYEIISGFTGGMSLFGVNVAHWAHVGGALIGFIIAYYWKKNSMNHTRWN